ncbi:glycosyltransferase [Catenuloplanes sp. NPDC051500]|uniref:glycosyltransferase n=1 Tax=Catenuloplanes sp. NPDC051500 TaxID=3363959 RepID=UPI0037AA19CC
MRILFFPYPVGAAHVGRCLVAAALLREAGHTCLFAADTPRQDVRADGFPVLGETPRITVGRRAPADTQRYLSSPSMDSAFAAAGLHLRSTLRHWFDRDLRVVHEAKADLVVTDMHLSGAMAARHLQVPTVGICESDYFGDAWNAWMPWLAGPLSAVSPYPSLDGRIRDLCDDLGLDLPASAPAITRGDYSLVAGFDFLDSRQPDLGGRGAYVGPLVWDPVTPGTAVPEPSGPRRPRILVTLGSGEVALGDATPLLNSLADTLAADVLFSTASPARYATGLSPGVRVTSFGSVKALMRWADIVVCHGGHGTILAAQQAGRPLCVVPALGENEANGRFMVEDVGVGRLARWTSQEDGARLAVHNGLFPDRSTLPIEDVVVSAAAQLLDPSTGFRERAHALAERIGARMDGVAGELVGRIEGMRSDGE